LPARMNQTAQKVLLYVVVAFFVLLRFPVNETVLTILGIVALAGLLWTLHSVDFSRDSGLLGASIVLSNSFSGKRRLSLRKNWPIAQALVTSVTRQLGGYAALAGNFPDALYVNYQFEVAGRLYSNQFAVICNPHDALFELIAQKAAGTEKISVRYDPLNPSDSLPADNSWHDWPIRAVGTTM
jgi:hypothetical protein